MDERPSIFGADPEQIDRLLAWPMGGDGEDAPTGALEQFAEGPGAQIGRYRLVRALGEGGMGVIYLAEQKEPVRREVALKILKPGMDSRRVLARFEVEQQALALMEHPYIARVYDAGVAPSGRPYFVMEHVQGLLITEHCDKHSLTIEQRLHLFLHVCEAVQHAHQKGIVHRDLKPSNILVTTQDKEAIPKVIDFGVARAMGEPLTRRTLFTEQGQLIGTPEYMSPEQADVGNQDIDTRTDIYSLGVVLYELLAGVLPFDPKIFREGGIEHIRKVICEEEPKTPSTRLSKTSAEESSECAKRRQTDVHALQRKLHGDLDWITLKALEKDRTRRYQTVSSLAEEIKHHLNNEPVLARPASRFYRFQKLVRWNKAVFVGTAVVAAALVMGLTISVVSLVRERYAQAKEVALRRQVQAEAYASDMSLAQQALAMNDLGRARRLLEAHRPALGERDLRDWEWRYLWQECRSDALGELCRYPNSAYSVAYSPDGKVLATAKLVDEIVEIWDVPSRKRIVTLQPEEGHLVAFSPHGDLLATDARNQIRLWRTGTWKLIDQLTVADYVSALKFSPDGTLLASLSYPGELIVWDVGQRTIVCRIPGVRLLGSHLGSLDFSPDGKALVVGDANHRLRVIDVASGSMNLDTPEAHPEPISFVAWSPNGSIIASGSGYVGGPIRLWEAASGKPLGALEGHTSWICELIFSKDSLRLYSASADQTIRIWDIGERQCLGTLRGSTDEVHGLALSPDGATLASACKDGVVAFWKAVPRPEQERPRLIVAGSFIRPAFAPDSRVLAVPRAGTVSLIDLATSKEIERLPALGTDVGAVYYSPDGTLLVSRCWSGKIRVWSCTAHRLLQELDDHKEPVPGLHFRADGTRLLSVSREGKTIWRDTLTWEAVRSFVADVVEPGSFAAGAVSPDGRLLVVGGLQGTVRWFNAESGELLATTAGAHGSRVAGITFSRDGTQAATVGQDGTLALWDPSSFRLITAFKGHMHGTHGVAFSPNGRRLVTGGGDPEVVKLWDVSTHRELLILPGQGSVFQSVGFSPDGRWLAACGLEGKVHLWHAPSWEEIEAAEKTAESGQSP